MINLVQELNLEDLGVGYPGLTRSIGETLAEACSVCLDNQRHVGQRIRLNVSGSFSNNCDLVFLLVTDQMRRAWMDLPYTTEQGAYGIAILLLLRLTDYTVIERSSKGSGVDYWLGEKNDPLFQRSARLEVSGILRGSDSVINYREKLKINQTTPSDTGGLPVYIVIVEYSSPQARVRRK